MHRESIRGAEPGLATREPVGEVQRRHLRYGALVHNKEKRLFKPLFSHLHPHGNLLLCASRAPKTCNSPGVVSLSPCNSHNLVIEQVNRKAYVLLSRLIGLNCSRHGFSIESSQL